MKKSLAYFQYARLLALYHKLNKRLNHHFLSKKFIAFSKAEQVRLILRLERVRNKLLRFESGLKLGASTLVLGTVLYSGQARAQFVVGSEFSVNMHTTSEQSFSSLAMDSDGDFVVAWQSRFQDGSSYGVYAQRYNALGVAQGAEFLVNSYSSYDQFQPSVAMDSDGDFVITWTSTNQDGASNGIYFKRYNSGGIAQGSEFLVNTYTTSQQSRSSVAMDSDGDFVVAWQSIQDGGGYGIYAQRYNATGTPQGLEFSVNTYTTNEQRFPSVAIDSDGDFVIAWESRAQDGSATGIYAQRYNSLGVVQGAELKVSTYTTAYQRYPSAAMDSSGDFVIAWQSRNQYGNYGIYAQRYNSTGAAQGSEFKINSYTTSSQFQPSVAMSDAGDFVVSWQSNGQDGSGYGIYGKRYTLSGIVLGSEFKINSYSTSDQKFPSVDVDSDGDFLVSWNSMSQDASNYGVFAQRFVSNNSPVISPQTFSIAENSATSTSLGIVVANDPDMGQMKSYAITAGNTAGKFAINSSTGEITVAGVLDYETLNSYALTVQVTDNGTPAKNSSAVVTINITEVSNENPPVISPQTFSIAENTVNATAVGTVLASDLDAGQTLSYTITAGNTGSVFAINSSTGAITVAGALDYEATNSYALTVEVTDNGSPVKSASAVVTINITNVNENPIISAQTFSIAENSANATAVGTVVASDLDVGQTLTYAITAGNTGSVFAINSTTGAITVGGVLDYETFNSYALTVEVTDDGTPIKNASATITINITDVVETTGTTTGSAVSAFVLYPNPAKDQVHLNLEGEVNVKIMDLSGQVIQEAYVENQSFNIAGLKAGVYMVEVTKDGEKVVKKLVVE